MTVGNSSLISLLDLSDTFTGTADGSSNPNRPYQAAIQGPSAYVVEGLYGNLTRSWSNEFSFASDRNPNNPGFVDGTPPFPGHPLVNENVSGSGTITGFTQTGAAVDYGVPFGLRNKFVAQFDAVQTTDRIDITVNSSQGGLASSTGLSVFFRAPGGPYGEIGLYRAGVGETNTGLTSGISSTTAWNNYAVAFDRPNNRIEVFQNEVSRGTIDLNTFAGGAYKDFAINAVNFGGTGGNRVWTDNAQIGVPSPLPGPASLVSYWNFDESATGTGTAWDQIHANNGTFAGTATRTAGLVGIGAARFNDQNADAVNVGTGWNGLNNQFSFSTGIAIEALFTTNWNGADEAEIFRKEDGSNRILLSFQRASNINNAFGQLVGTAGVPGISLGLNIGGSYGEMDVAFDGLGGRPTLAQVADGRMHHVVATYDAASGVKSIWLDGSLIASVNLTPGSLITSGGGATAFIGSHSGSWEPFTGILDEVALYSQALSARDIAYHFDMVQGGFNYYHIPEPSAWTLGALMGAATLGAGALGRRRARGVRAART